MSSRRVLVFGDSGAFGCWGDNGGWVDVLRRSASKLFNETNGDKKCQIFNLGIGGDTSRNILNRLENEIVARIKKTGEWQTILVFAFGTNDSHINDGEEKIPMTEFCENIEKIIEVARKYSNQIYFVEPPCLSDGKLVWKKVMLYTDARIKEYANILHGIAEKNGVEFIEVFDQIFDQRDSYFCSDKFHLNSRGHELIARVVGEKLGLKGEE